MTDAARPRVVVISHGYYPRIGGIERQRAQVTPRLVRGGAVASVVTRAVAGAPRRETLDGVEVVRLATLGGKARGSAGTRQLLWRLAKPWDAAVFLLGGTAAVLRRRPDVIHTHEFISTARVGLLAGRLLGVPVVVTSHRSGPLGDVGRNLTSRRGRALLERIRTRAALAVAVSEEIDGELAEAGIPAERRLVVHNGVDVDRFRPATEQERAAGRAGLGLPEEGPVVVFVGRLMPEKRVDLLLEVWGKVRASAPAASLVVVGTGDDEDRLRAAAPAGVVFAGSVPDPAPLLRAADVFVLPSVAEGLSNALLEAQATGLPAVVTDIGAARTVVEDGVTGVVIEPDDAEALRSSLEQLVADVALRARMGSVARDRMVERFSIDATAAAFLAAYRRLLEEH